MTAAFVLGGIGLAAGILLSIARRALAGREIANADAVTEAIDALLPQSQCAQCGYPGCRPYAEAVAAGERLDRCPPGGRATVVALEDLLGRKADDAGMAEPADQVARIVEQDCIGCALCIDACPVDAIAGAAKYLHAVIAQRCTGCELCVPACPVDCIDLVPRSVSQERGTAFTASRSFRTKGGEPARATTSVAPTRSTSPTDTRSCSMQERSPTPGPESGRREATVGDGLVPSRADAAAVPGEGEDKPRPYGPLPTPTTAKRACSMEERSALPCIACGWCETACPVDLKPQALHVAFETGAEDATVFDCIECTACTRSCPSGIDLLGEFRTLKERLGRERETAARADAARRNSDARSERLARQAREQDARRAERLRAPRQWQ